VWLQVRAEKVIAKAREEANKINSKAHEEAEKAIANAYTRAECVGAIIKQALILYLYYHSVSLLGKLPENAKIINYILTPAKTRHYKLAPSLKN
jgi:hypothetical protein